MWGRALLRAWSKTMPAIMLSTGEAELGALVKGATEAEGIVAIMRDFDSGADILLESDASAAVGITQRQGLGKIRHLAVGDLWIQQRVKDGVLRIGKIPGKDNPADLMTKALDFARMVHLTAKMGLSLCGMSSRPS